MHILDIHTPALAATVDDILRSHTHVYTLVHMNGCGACIAMKPDWDRMTESIAKPYEDRSDVAILTIERGMLPNIAMIKNVDGFPTIRHYSQSGQQYDDYIDRPRTADAFTQWIESGIMHPFANVPSIYERLSKPKPKPKSKSKLKLKSKSKSKVKSKTRVKSKTKAKAKAKSKLKTKTKAKTKSKTRAHGRK